MIIYIIIDKFSRKYLRKEGEEEELGIGSTVGDCISNGGFSSS